MSEDLTKHQPSSDTAELLAGQQRLEAGLEFLRSESREIRTILRDIFRQLDILDATLVIMQGDYRDFAQSSALNRAPRLNPQTPSSR